MPTILEPSHKMSASQKIYMTVGVPDPAKNRNAVESVVRIDPTIATSDLNQRFKSRTMKKAAKTEMMIDGSLTEYSDKPKVAMLMRCKTRYGRSTILPLAIKSE